MRRKFFALIFVGFLTVILSVAVNANPDGPRVTDPMKYSEHRIGSDITINWNAPDSSYGEVSYYKVAVRGFEIDDDVTASNVGSIVASGSIPAKFKYCTINGSDLLEHRNYEKYRLSVGAVMKDGTNRWSDHIYFYISANNTPLNTPVSFHIYNGFATESKEKIYYSCQSWNEKINFGYEIINTYPYTQGTNKTSASYDGVNIVTKGEIKEDPEALMGTTTWYTKSGSNAYRVLDADIVVSYNKPWANYISNDTYNFHNAMIHEMGHVIGLNDKYDSWATEWTMYGRCSKGENKKITLATRDVVNAISILD